VHDHVNVHEYVQAPSRIFFVTVNVDVVVDVVVHVDGFWFYDLRPAI
jgi:hypothetical protein